MKRKIFVIMSIATLFVICSDQTRAQTKPTEDLPKYEVGADFSSLSFSSGTTLPGLGGRFTYNLNKHVALEAAGYFFPGKCDTCSGEITGHITEGLFGVKIGKRFKRWGVFGKARPGVIRFGKGFFDFVPTGGAGPFPFRIDVHSSTNFALDVGAVLEFYPSKKIVLRFDGGETLIHYSRRTVNVPFLDPITGAGILVPFPSPGYTRRTFQFTGGVGFRF